MGLGTTPKAGKSRHAGHGVYGLHAAHRQGRGIAIAPGLARNLLRGRWLLITLLILIAAGVMVRLGLWQLGRLEGRRAANAVIARQLQLPPLTLDGAALATADPSALVFRRVSVRGTWDYDHEVELRYRTYDGQAGVHILTPLRIAGAERALLVDRGWIPYQQAGPEGRRAYRQGDSAEITGLVYESQAQMSASAEPGVFSQVDLPAIGAQVPYPLAGFWVRRLPGASNSILPLAEGLPDLDDGPHLGYLIQWWAFAATLLITYVIFANQAMLRERSKRAGRQQADIVP